MCSDAVCGCISSSGETATIQTHFSWSPLRLTATTRGTLLHQHNITHIRMRDRRDDDDDAAAAVDEKRRILCFYNTTDRARSEGHLEDVHVTCRSKTGFALQQGTVALYRLYLVEK